MCQFLSGLTQLNSQKLGIRQYLDELKCKKKVGFILEYGIDEEREEEMH